MGISSSDRHYDFAGWASRYNVKCGDGRTIRSGAMKDCDGREVPLVYNHSHGNINDVLGHTLLEERPNEGIYCYGWFNETDSGKQARAAVDNGDIRSLSIYANKLKQNGADVIHGNICEVSLVLAGANPGAYIDSVMAHGELSDEEAIIYNDIEDGLEIYHGELNNDGENSTPEEQPKEGTLEHSAKENNMADKTNEELDLNELQPEFTRVMNGLSEKDQMVINTVIGLAREVGSAEADDEGGSEDMKHNIFEYGPEYNGAQEDNNVLSHSDEMNIIEAAKGSNFGSLKKGIAAWESENNAVLAHSFDHETIGYLYEDFRNIPTGAPNTVTRDQEWVTEVLNGITKVPNTRLRTRHVDARTMAFARGYVTGTEKQKQAALNVTKRETTPQTVYIKEELNKDDVDDITDFDSVQYSYNLIRTDLNETLAMSILVGDQREDNDPAKVKEDHIRPIWTDSSLYVVRGEIDMAAAKQAVQGTGTSVNFGDNFVFSEAMIEKSLTLRKSYHGSGNLVCFCPTSVLNTMLLAKDRNGRRIYNNATDLASALNVKKIVPVEAFENLTREVTVEGVEKTKKLVCIMVNLADYEMGAVKNGQVAKFEDFDIDFNLYKILLETRASGTLAKLFSAIVIEEDVTSNG